MLLFFSIGASVAIYPASVIFIEGVKVPRPAPRIQFRW